MKIEEYINLYDNNNSSGIYTSEKWLRNNALDILETILQTEGDTISEKAYRFRFKILDTPTCKGCNKKVKYKNRTVGFQKYCSNSCSARESKEIAKNTMIKEYGVNHPSLIPINIKKRKESRINLIKKEIGNSKLISVSEKEEYEIKCDICNKIHKTERKVLEQRLYLGLDWRDCVSKSFSVSNGENELKDFIKSIYNNTLIFNDRKTIGKEIDILIPELKIGIEYNGLFWHSEVNKKNNYHYMKYSECKKRGINLIQIFEDEWIYKKNIIKSRIKNILNLTDRKIYARKCIVKTVDHKTTNEFLTKNHLQGSIRSSINLGLFHNDEMVSLMTFGKPRGSMSSKNGKDRYELYRFCNELNTNVVGGASKLFRHFIKNSPKVSQIYSFSANEWIGTLYEKIGMEYDSESKISYWYLKNNKRVSRHNYTKVKLVKMGYDPKKSEHEIMKELKIYRIYGSGNSKFVWNRLKNKKPLN
jgi:hypothetical protein